MDAHIGTGRPRFEAWRAEIDRATDAEAVVATIRRYLSSWTLEALALLPSDLAAPALPGREAIYARAFLASRAELDMTSDDPRHAAVREMALVMTAAANRLTALEYLRSASHLRPPDRAIPADWKGELEAEIRQRQPS